MIDTAGKCISVVATEQHVDNPDIVEGAELAIYYGQGSGGNESYADSIWLFRESYILKMNEKEVPAIREIVEFS